MKQFFAILAVSIFLASCADSINKPASQIKMAGSTTLDRVMNLIIETYHQKNPSVSLSYEALGSSVGIKNLFNGTIDVAGSSRDLQDNELAEGLVPHVIGLDGLAIIVNSDTHIKNLSQTQVTDIFSGRIMNWSDVGGSNLPVALLKRDESSGTYTSFKELVLKGQDYAQGGLVANSNGDIMSKVAYTIGSIGYIGMSCVTDIDRSKSNIVAIDNILPNEKTISEGTYPISRKIYLITKEGKLSPAVADLLDFVLSSEGKDLILSSGFFPSSPHK